LQGKLSAAALAASVVAAVVVAGCGSSKPTTSTTKPAVASASTCVKGKLPTYAKGELTVATDSPAYPPYFEDNKPSNGKGFESSVAYAVAAKLGFSPSQVKWVVEHFNESYAPGPKHFDFDINEISITPQRAQQVDFSKPYYTNPQAIIVNRGSTYSHPKKLADLKPAKFGVQIGTTSLEAVDHEIKPTQQPDVFNNSNDVVNALKIGRVQAIAVDLATAFYLTSSEIPHTTIAGQFNAPGGDNWGLLLSLHSPLTSCVSRAVSALHSNGTLASLSNRWIASAASVPVLY
jgi:polar amino acid transport system substrate-binding protein